MRAATIKEVSPTMCGYCEKAQAITVYEAYDGDVMVCDECYKWARDTERADKINRGDW